MLLKYQQDLTKFSRRDLQKAHGQRGTAWIAQILNPFLAASDVARAEKHRLPETEVGITGACSRKIQWPGGLSDRDRPRIPGAMPASRQQRSG